MFLDIFLDEKGDYLSTDLTKDTFAIRDPRGRWIIGTWDSFNKFFTCIDEKLHDENETYKSLQDRILESQVRIDKLQEEIEIKNDIIENLRERNNGRW